MITKDFDRFMAEREGGRMRVVILGRTCEVPRELPWQYMLKVERMLRTGEPVRGEDNIALVRQVLSPEDYDYVTGHPDFRASWFWELIAFAWLRGDAPAKTAPAFTTEDEARVLDTREARSKKRRSAR